MSAPTAELQLIEAAHREIARHELNYAERQLVSEGALTTVLERVHSGAMRSSRVTVAQCALAGLAGGGMLAGAVVLTGPPWIWAACGGVQLVVAVSHAFLSRRHRTDAHRCAELLAALRECKIDDR